MTGSDDPLLQRAAQLRSSIDDVAGGRRVRIVAAAKGVPAERVRIAVDAGLSEVGENYVRELRAKAPDIPEARWHFFGALQSGTAHHVADLADVVETLTGGRATERLARRSREAGKTIEALIEVDLTGSRSGVGPADLTSVADEIASLDGVRLVGLMTLPPLPRVAEDSRPYFAKLRGLRDRVQASHPEVVDLSMGMSLDYEVAVQEGATMVRIGTALFGPRP